VSKTKIIIVSLAIAASLLVFSLYVLAWSKFVSPVIANIKIARIANRLVTAEELYRRSGGNNVLLRGYVDDFFLAGRLSLENKRYDNAIEFYTFGLQIDCWRPDKIFELGLAYEKKGMYKEAYERFNQSLSLNPGPIVYLKAKLHLWAIRNKVKGLKIFAEGLNIAQGRLKAKTIYMLGFGVSDREMLDDLRVLLQDAYKVKFVLLEELKKPVGGFSEERNQYFVTPLIRDVRLRYEDVFSSPDTQAILVVTSYDITDEGLNFLFGKSDAEYGLGVISYHRFLFDNPDKKTLFMRVYTQGLSTAGFLLGLPRCSSSGCARSYPHSLEEFKRKSHTLCKECKHNLNVFLEKVKDIPEIDVDSAEMERLKSVKSKYGIK